VDPELDSAGDSQSIIDLERSETSENSDETANKPILTQNGYKNEARNGFSQQFIDKLIKAAAYTA
jgi:hypothetical protein